MKIQADTKSNIEFLNIGVFSQVRAIIVSDFFMFSSPSKQENWGILVTYFATPSLKLFLKEFSL